MLMNPCEFPRRLLPHFETFPRWFDISKISIRLNSSNPRLFLFSLHLRRMARSAMDATRFTATGPCAHSKPGTKASVLAFADPPPPNETPQQKVARLREAARRAKLEQVSRFDKVVAKGRVVADTAHRFTAITLIAATGM